MFAAAVAVAALTLAGCARRPDVDHDDEAAGFGEYPHVFVSSPSGTDGAISARSARRCSDTASREMEARGYRRANDSPTW